MRPVNSVVGFAVSLGLLLACGKTGETPPQPVAQGPQANFQWISKNIFETRCVVCHNSTKPRAKVDLSSYDALMSSTGTKLKPITAGRAEESAVYKEVAEQKMPPEPRYFSNEEKQALFDWIMAGAPEKTPGVVLPPQGQPNPPQPNFEWLSANSFRRCASCHGAPFKVAGIDFTSYSTLLASAGHENKALTPGDPDKSQIYAEVAEKEMPPPRHGLSDDEVKAVGQWIAEGAKNN